MEALHQHGLCHLLAVAGIPGYAAPQFEPQPAYAGAGRLTVVDGCHLADGAWSPAEAAGWWLARCEELSGPHDEYGRWDPTGSLSWELRHTPPLDRWAHELLPLAEARAAERGFPLVRIACWPEGAALACSGSHDIDHVRKWRLATLGSYLLGRGRPARIGRLQALREYLGGTEPWWRFDDIRELEQELGFDSTWFVIPRQRHQFDTPFTLQHRRDRQQVDALRAAGQEVGVHGSCAGLERTELAAIERQEMEGAVGVRQHWLRFTVGESWPAQAAAGYCYDSSLGFTHGWGLRGGTAFPFAAWDHTTGNPLEMGELPLTVMDREGANDPQLPQKLLETVGGGHLNLLWHVAAFDDRDFPGYGEMYRRVIEAAQDAGAWFASLAQVWEWWRRRARIDLEPSKTGLTLNAPERLEGVVLRGPLKPPRGGSAIEGGVALPVVQGRLELEWS